MRRRTDGFTLVEVITAVLVLGIVFAVAVPVFSSAIAQDQQRICESQRAMIDDAVTTFVVYGDLYTLPAGVRTLVPSYLKSVPRCPSSGRYSLTVDGDVRCSVHLPNENPPALSPDFYDNFALASNGAAATASSQYNSSYPVSAVIDGDRGAINPKWAAGGGWNDLTSNSWNDINGPDGNGDWIIVTFAAPKSIDRVDVFTLQNNHTSPVEPTPTTSSTTNGITAFRVEYWTGSAWQLLPTAAVTGNTLAWRTFEFPEVKTTKIRLTVQAGKQYSRVVEIEAWGYGE